MASLKHNKSKYKKQKISDPLYFTSNRYNHLDNDVDFEDNIMTKMISVSVKEPIVNSVGKNRVNNCKRKNWNCKKKEVRSSMHKVLIVGDSHARGGAAEVKLKLNSDYEVVGFLNPGSTMKAIKELTKDKIDQLMKEDIVVLWGGQMMWQKTALC